MPNYIEYQKSVADEFKAYENRVRNIIDDHHWGEDGRFKEIILMNYLKRVLPKRLSVGTGFVKSRDNITTQIDIIVYDNTFPLLFSEGDFIIAVPENVVGIIEVKSNLICANLPQYIEKANRNSLIICGNTDKHLFNGIFSFNCKSTNHQIYNAIKALNFEDLLSKQYFNQPCSNRLFNCVNHITFDSKRFLKLWPTGQQDRSIAEIPPYYSLYDMQNELAIAYFISNLQEFILRYTARCFEGDLPEELGAFLYPIPEGKEIMLNGRISLRHNN